MIHFRQLAFMGAAFFLDIPRSFFTVPHDSSFGEAQTPMQFNRSTAIQEISHAWTQTRFLAEI